jgi:hypothetical protein
MPLMKFQTMGRDTHRFGRIALTVDANPFQKKLFITVLEGRQLNGVLRRPHVISRTRKGEAASFWFSPDPHGDTPFTQFAAMGVVGWRTIYKPRHLYLLTRHCNKAVR